VDGLLAFSRSIGRSYTAAWVRPNLLRVYVTNATANLNALRGRLTVRVKTPLTSPTGKQHASRTAQSPVCQ
jgi:hypothetical protein